MIDRSPSQISLRHDWVIEALRTSLAAVDASADGAGSCWDVLASTVRAMEPPQGAIEHLVATHILQRAAWALIARQVESGSQTHAMGHEAFVHVVTILEGSAWPQIARRFLALAHAHREAPLAIRVRDYLDTHATTRVNLADVARALGSTRHQVATSFRAHFGLSAHAYVTRRRLVEAVRLLQATDLKIAAVALSVGFRDQTALYRHFARAFKRSPAALRSRPQEATHLLNDLDRALKAARSPMAAIAEPPQAAPDISLAPVDVS